MLLACSVGAHEIRPAYLEIRETSPNRYQATWRTPLMSGMRLPVALALPDGARNLSLPVVLEGTDALMERREVEIPGGLPGKRLGFIGLEATITDVLVRLSLLDGRQLTAMVRPSRAYLDVDPSPATLEVAKVYVVQGVEHILQGIDHLLFVFGLMLLVRDRWMLLKTITAFTLAHSFTLAGATFGIIQVPAGPVEATIALSILFLGVEVVRAKQGRTSFTIRRPWAMAFAFGLLHGLGFASGLSMIGLPPADIPLALLAFNVGVETGQLLFVALIVLLDLAIRQLRVRIPRLVTGAPPYFVGCLGAYWTLDRLVLMGGAW
jgi:hydrogenase/urease accessory protein HupE